MPKPTRPKREPEICDVDAMFEGVECIGSMSAARARVEKERAQRARMEREAQTRAHAGPSRQKRPEYIVISDDEDTPSRPLNESVLPTPGTSMKSKGKAREIDVQQQQPRKPKTPPVPLSTKSKSRVIPTPVSSLGLLKPVTGPSISSSASASGFFGSHNTFAANTKQNVHTIEDSDDDARMDVDEDIVPDVHMPGPSITPAFIPIKAPAQDVDSDYSTEYWSEHGDDDMETDNDGVFGFRDFPAEVDEAKPANVRLPLCQSPAVPQIRSNVLRNHTTSAPWPEKKGKCLRMWDDLGNTYPSGPHRAFKVDPPARFVRKEALGGTVPSRSRQHAPPNCMLTATPLRLNHPSFKKTSGTITKIAQSHGDIAVASATSGGVPDTRTNQDDPQPEVDAYNRDGNLLVWTGQEFFKLKAHERNWIVSSHVGRELISHEQTKVYTVNDIAFDPIRPRRLVSSGNDCAVRIWDLQNHVDESFDVRPQNRLDYTHAPHDISFKPNSSVFAVSCFDGNIHVHPRNGEHFELGVCDPSASKPGTFLWGGTAANSGLHNLLFASSESNDDEISCSHVAFDVDLQRQIYEFKIYDSGDSMALDPNGETLALITSTSDSHTLSLFDVGRADGRRAFAELALPPQVHVPNLHAAQQDKLEVSFAAFSPDSVLLALARTDDVTLVYDARFLGNGRPGGARPWACLRHPPSAAGYGTTGLHWVEGFARGSLGLVTAASDGCVRLWDVMRAPASEEESLVLAKLDNDIACFSIGDQYKNERRLVVGDCSGEVYIFD